MSDPVGGEVLPTDPSDSVPIFVSWALARSLAVSPTGDGITIEMQCGSTLLAVHLSPDEWDDFRADGDDARAAFEAGLEDPDRRHDLETER